MPEFELCSLISTDANKKKKEAKYNEPSKMEESTPSSIVLKLQCF